MTDEHNTESISRRNVLKAAGATASGALVTGQVQAQPGTRLGPTNFTEFNFEAELPELTSNKQYETSHSDVTPEYVIGPNIQKLYLIKYSAGNTVEAFRNHNTVARARGPMALTGSPPENSRSYGVMNKTLQPEPLSSMMFRVGDQLASSDTIPLAEPLAVPAIDIQKTGQRVTVSAGGETINITPHSEEVLDIGTREATVNTQQVLDEPSVTPPDEEVDLREEFEPGKPVSESVLRQITASPKSLEWSTEQVELDLQLRVTNFGNIRPIDATEKMVTVHDGEVRSSED